MSGKRLVPTSPRVWPIGTVSTDTRRPDDFKDSKANEATSSHDLGRGNRKDSIRFDLVTGALLLRRDSLLSRGRRDKSQVTPGARGLEGGGALTINQSPDSTWTF